MFSSAAELIIVCGDCELFMNEEDGSEGREGCKYQFFMFNLLHQQNNSHEVVS